ncbi:MAG: DUF2460 domain-containing protein [Burkholderiales bacterium]|nr:DUF2460 domain-containing protein [Burkholderiales bacterium]
MTPFVEERVNDGLVIYGTIGGPHFSTEIGELRSGAEQRNQRYSSGLGDWELGDRLVKKEELSYIIGFFRARRGSTVGFRYKDWGDFEVGQADGRLLGTLGQSTYQLGKRYGSGADYEGRVIRKPVAGTVTVYRNGTPVSVGAGAGQISLDTTTGQVVFVPDVSRAISAISKASNCQITTAVAHPFSNGQAVYLAGIGGMVQLNARIVTVTVVDATKFTIGIDTSGYGTYTSGGTAARYAQGSEVLTWAGQFDVPVRFASDRLRHRFRAMDPGTGERLFDLDTLPIKELRKP